MHNELMDQDCLLDNLREGTSVTEFAVQHITLAWLLVRQSFLLSPSSCENQEYNSRMAQDCGMH